MRKDNFKMLLVIFITLATSLFLFRCSSKSENSSGGNISGSIKSSKF